MFGNRYFGARYYGDRFFGDGGAIAPPVGDCPTTAAIWGYVLSNGKTAGANLVENNTMLLALTSGGAGGWSTLIEGPYSAADILRILAAVAAGKTTITPTLPDEATVTFRAIDDSELRVTAAMDHSVRAGVTINPS